MKKYNVYFTAYDNHEWRHRDGITTVEANSEKEAKERVQNYSNCNEEFFVNRKCGLEAKIRQDC